MKVPEPRYTSIISHNDLDGVASAALLSYIFDVDRIVFTGPTQVDRQVVDEQTIICDLPYPRACGLWFDHHVSNRQSLALRGIDADQIPGELTDKPSCLRVIYEHFLPEYDLEDWEPFVREVDVMDGFLYKSVKEYKKATPGRDIECACKHAAQERTFLFDLAMMLRDQDYREVAKSEMVRERAQQFRNNEQSMVNIIRKNATFLGPSKEIIVIDFTGHQKPPSIVKSLSFTVFPKSMAVIEARCQYEHGMKTNDLYLSMSLGLVGKKVKAVKDVGEIMRRMNIGDGHPGAAAGLIRCSGKAAREKALQEALQRVQEIWYSQK